MAIYFEKDLKVDDDGDIVVSSGGDIALADSAESTKHAMKFIVATDFNEVKPQPLMGANLGSLIGRTDITEVVSEIPMMVRQANQQIGLVESSDLAVHAIPLDVNHVYVSVEITGTYLDDDAQPLDAGTIYLEYTFPYTEEKITALS